MRARVEEAERVNAKCDRYSEREGRDRIVVRLGDVK
jgi:hypothetical protein